MCVCINIDRLVLEKKKVIVELVVAAWLTCFSSWVRRLNVWFFLDTVFLPSRAVSRDRRVCICGRLAHQMTSLVSVGIFQSDQSFLKGLSKISFYTDLKTKTNVFEPMK